MRAPTAVAVLILAAGVALSVALPLPGSTYAPLFCCALKSPSCTLCRSEHAARTDRVRSFIPPHQVKPLSNPAAPPAPRPPAVPPAPASPTRPTRLRTTRLRPVILAPPPAGHPVPRPRPPAVPPASELPLYPNRGTHVDPNKRPDEGEGVDAGPQAQKSGIKKLWGKLFGRTLIATPPNDELFGQPK